MLFLLNEKVYFSIILFMAPCAWLISDGAATSSAA
jgi:hypothetical protein